MLPSAREDLLLWIRNVSNNPHNILQPSLDLTLKCDSTLQGWGSIIDGTTYCAGGRWSKDEMYFHINYLELKAIYLGLQAICSSKTDIHIKVLQSHTSKTWEAPIPIYAMILPDKLLYGAKTGMCGCSFHAYQASRVFNDDTEWSLDCVLYNDLVTKWGKPDIDLFACRLNHKVDLYVSWKADPMAIATDTLSIDWSSYKLIFCFSPFSLIGKVLQKTLHHQVTAVVVVPKWKTQFWYPPLVKLMVDTRVKIMNSKKTLTLPYNPDKIHPLYPILQLLGCLLSRKPSQPKE